MNKLTAGSMITDPAHFLPVPNRRNFLHVGAVGFLGLSLEGCPETENEPREAAEFGEPEAF